MNARLHSVLDYHYDPARDVLEVEGVEYGAELFRGLAGAFVPGSWFQIARRHEHFDGTRTVYVRVPGWNCRMVEDWWNGLSYEQLREFAP